MPKKCHQNESSAKMPLSGLLGGGSPSSPIAPSAARRRNEVSTTWASSASTPRRAVAAKPERQQHRQEQTFRRLPNPDSLMTLATNLETGEAVYLGDDGQWKPAQKAIIPESGETLAPMDIVSCVTIAALAEVAAGAKLRSRGTLRRPELHPRQHHSNRTHSQSENTDLPQAPKPEAFEFIPGPKLRAKLGISAVTLWRWRHDKEKGFPAPKVINGRLYFALGAVMAWLARQVDAS
jgi:predicted DNA-binding transcriptional regulator AlpA